MSLLAAACFLAGVAVVNCDPGAQRFEHAVSKLPAGHWALVRELEIRDDRRKGRFSYNGMVLWLPRKASDSTLFHEVGHAWAYVRGLNDDYEREFWRRGKAKGKTTGYGKSKPAEDLAECYAESVGHHVRECSRARIEWIRARY